MHICVCYIDSWNWTVLLPSDTHRKPIMSITAILLPFVTYLLTIINRIAQYGPQPFHWSTKGCLTFLYTPVFKLFIYVD
jgi:hypothetical protein